MKKTIQMLIALLFCCAVMSACSDKDDEINVVNPDPATDETVSAPSQQQTYTLTINATKGENAGLSKALSLSGTTLNATWKQGEVVAVYTGRNKIGELTAQSDGTSTTLSGEFSGDNVPAVGETLTLKFNDSHYDVQGGTLEYIEKNCDYAETTVTVNGIEDGKIIADDVVFANKQAIVKFTLMDKSGNPLSASSLTVTSKNQNLVSDRGYNTISRHTGGYNYISGSEYADATSNLVDGNTTTKWCSNPSHKTDGKYFCEFQTSSAVRVDGYTLTTGNDNSTWKGRNPKDWVLKAKVDGNWVDIATVNEDNTMEDKNYTPYDFKVDVPGTYQHFRIEISSTRSGDGTMQLGELQLFELTYGSLHNSLTVKPEEPSNTFFVAMCIEDGSSFDTYSLQANVGGTTYSYSKDGVHFENGHYYEVRVKMNDAPAYADKVKSVSGEELDMVEMYFDRGDYQRITLDEAYALATYLSAKDGKTVAVVYDYNMDEGSAVYALSSDGSATEHSDYSLRMYVEYEGWNVYVVKNDTM